jgi:hypothetical protein
MNTHNLYLIADWDEWYKTRDWTGNGKKYIIYPELQSTLSPLHYTTPINMMGRVLRKTIHESHHTKTCRKLSDWSFDSHTQTHTQTHLHILWHTPQWSYLLTYESLHHEQFYIFQAGLSVDLVRGVPFFIWYVSVITAMLYTGNSVFVVE